MLDIDAGKAASVAVGWRPGFELVAATAVTAQLQLSPADLRALVAMGPTARHRSAEQIAAAVAALPEPTVVTMSVTVSRLRRNAEHLGPA
jgi:23S rRNA (guanine745-N1)-methyltransferase